MICYILRHIDAAIDSPAAGLNYRSTLDLLGSLFFMWCFITVVNNTLLPHLRAVFEAALNDS